MRGFTERRIALIARMNIQTACGLALGTVPTANGGKFGPESFGFLLSDVTIATSAGGKGTLTREVSHARLVRLFSSGRASRRYIVSVNAIGTSARGSEETGFHVGFLFPTGGLQRDAFILVDVVLSSRHDGVDDEIQAERVERMERGVVCVKTRDERDPRERREERPKREKECVRTKFYNVKGVEQSNCSAPLTAVLDGAPTNSPTRLFLTSWRGDRDRRRK